MFNLLSVPPVRRTRSLLDYRPPIRYVKADVHAIGPYNFCLNCGADLLIKRVVVEPGEVGMFDMLRLLLGQCAERAVQCQEPSDREVIRILNLSEGAQIALMQHFIEALEPTVSALCGLRYVRPVGLAEDGKHIYNAYDPRAEFAQSEADEKIEFMRQWLGIIDT